MAQTPLETPAGAQAKVDAHADDPVDAHDASAVSFLATAEIPDGDVQSAIERAATLPAGIDEVPLVHKAGAETITGAKDFTGGLTIGGDDAETVDGAQAKANAARMAAVAEVLGGVPEELLNTITELAVQLRSDESAASALTTLLATETTNRTDADALKLDKASNLSDIASIATARTNLGVASAARAINTQVVNYQVAASDLDGLIAMNKATAGTLTIPTNAVTPIGNGRYFDVINLSAALLTIVPPGGGAVNSPSGLTLGQNESARLIKRATDTWDLTARSGASVDLLARVAYNPVGAGSFAFTSSTFADIDAANLAITFTAPANGSVLIILEMVARSDNSAGSLLWNLRDAVGDVAGTSRLITTGGAQRIRERTSVGVSGLVPGQQYTWKWGAASLDNVNNVRGQWGGTNGPAILEAWRGT